MLYFPVTSGNAKFLEISSSSPTINAFCVYRVVRKVFLEVLLYFWSDVRYTMTFVFAGNSAAPLLITFALTVSVSPANASFFESAK